MIRMVIWTKHLILTLTFLTLITCNLLTLTHSAFNTALSNLMSTDLGVQTVSGALRGKIDAKNKTIKQHTAAAVKRKAAARRFGTRCARRGR